jgi:hypothetical protein
MERKHTSIHALGSKGVMDRRDMDEKAGMRRWVNGRIK